jgi:hypothetical protein
MDTWFYGYHHTISILIWLIWFGRRLKESRVLQQQHSLKWVWNESFEDVRVIIEAGLFIFLNNMHCHMK